MNFKEYLNEEKETKEEGLDEAKNTFTMGDYQRSDAFDIGTKMLKGKISLNIAAKVINPHKSIYENGESISFELDYDREGIEKQIKDQITKMVEKSAKKVTALEFGGSSLLAFPSIINADPK